MVEGIGAGHTIVASRGIERCDPDAVAIDVESFRTEVAAVELDIVEGEEIEVVTAIAYGEEAGAFGKFGGIVRPSLRNLVGSDQLECLEVVGESFGGIDLKLLMTVGIAADRICPKRERMGLPCRQFGGDQPVVIGLIVKK